MGLTISETLSKPNMRSVFKAEHGQIGYSVVSVLVNRFINSFGFSTKMSDTQIEILTVDTLENFAYESLEDIIIFFKMARTGKFGSTKRGVDSNLIFGEWYPAYLEQKAELRERAYQREKVQLNSNPITIADVHKTYENYAKVKTWDKVKAHIDDITDGIDRETLEKLITAWSADPRKVPYLDMLKRKRVLIK